MHVGISQADHVAGEMGYVKFNQDVLYSTKLYTHPPVQGEPVAVVMATGGPHDKEDRVLCELQAELPPIGTKLYAHADPAEQPLHGFPKYGQTMLDALKQGRPFIVTPHDPADGKGYDLKLVDSCADPTEVERLRSELENSYTVAEHERLVAKGQEINVSCIISLRAQLADAQALLREVADTPIKDYIRRKLDAYLSARAEPSTPDEQDAGRFSVGTMARGQAECEKFNKQ